MRHRSPTVEAALALILAGWFQSGAASEVCASCHQKIYDAYRATPMAQSARKLDTVTVPESLDRASFTHSASGFRYAVSVQKNKYVLEFGKTSGGRNGSKVLAYAVGSGARAYSYLIEDDGYLYEAPVAYYSKEQSWGLAPGYERYSYPYLTRPIVPGCLSCHASLVQVEPLALNRYASPAFLEGGVACERCHGDGVRHVAKMQSGDVAGDPQILNPANLPPDRRDSICAQCHLTGDARVTRRGTDWRSYQPGGRLSDYQAVFVRSRKADGMTVTGHVENLATSACKRGSGGRLWCGSCHDPHVVPPPEQSSAWFRERCLSCHTTKPCTETRAVRMKAKDDCVTCHMPKSPATDAQHTVFTDHSIPRRPRRTSGPASAIADAELVPFNGAPSTSRDLAMAYAIAAIGKTAGADRIRALKLLEQTAKEAPDDAEVLMSLAEIYRSDGKNDLARPLYERAIKLDPSQVTASVGLGGIMMERGDYAAAVELWKDALAKNAGLQLVRLNYALALWKIGRHDAAEANLKKARDLNPSFVPSRELQEQLNALSSRPYR